MSDSYVLLCYWYIPVDLLVVGFWFNIIGAVNLGDESLLLLLLHIEIKTESIQERYLKLGKILFKVVFKQMSLF